MPELTMAIDNPSLSWDPNFSCRSPMYQPLQKLADWFSIYALWPGLDVYQQFLDAWPEPISLLSGKSLQIVKQDSKPSSFEAHYAPRIYMTGEIQTRTENWHDFFQFLSWFIFPKAKAVINAIHVPLARQRIEAGETGRRTPMENMLSLFDEGGAVIVSSDEALLQLVRDFQWKELFWYQRDVIKSKLSCITFGHAMYEKGLAPYVGLTANCILLNVDDSFFKKNNTEQLAWLDEELATLFTRGDLLTKPKDLSPFPILGMPGWDPDNRQEAYYDNVRYFRPGRSQ